MKTPLNPIEYVERERERLLARRGRQSVRALVRRLVSEDTGNVGLAAEIIRVAEARAIILPVYRTVAEQRALLVSVIDELLLHVPYSPAEDRALDVFLGLIDDWTEPVQ